MRITTIILASCVLLLKCRRIEASVTYYDNADQWIAATGVVNTITFADLPPNTWITEQYAYLGVHFTDGSDQVLASDAFVSDGIGLNGAFDDTTLQFDDPIYSIAMLFPGFVNVTLYYQNQLIFSSPTLGNDPVNNFRGLISTMPFDKAVLHDGGLFVDNLYFGPPVPGPGALALLGVGGLMMRSRRR